MFETPQAAPAFLRTLAELKHQGQNRLAGHAAPRLSRPEPHGGKRRFNRIRGSNVLPVRSREIVEGQKFLAILLRIPNQAAVLLKNWILQEFIAIKALPNQGETFKLNEILKGTAIFCDTAT